MRYSSGSPVDHINALHGRRTFESVAALLADGVLDHYETETNARMRHGPNASLQLQILCVEDRAKRKSRGSDGLDAPRRMRIEYRIDMHHFRHLQIVFGEGTIETSWLGLALLLLSSAISLLSVLSFTPVFCHVTVQPSV
jgi:hypothetical protein